MLCKDIEHIKKDAKIDHNKLNTQLEKIKAVALAGYNKLSIEIELLKKAFADAQRKPQEDGVRYFAKIGHLKKLLADTQAKAKKKQ